jgi:hypothetical protein
MEGTVCSVAYSFLKRIRLLARDPDPPPGRYDAWCDDFLEVGVPGSRARTKGPSGWELGIRILPFRVSILIPHFRDNLLPTNLQALFNISIYAGLNAVKTPRRCTPSG